jgi:hypothetical protein
VALERSDKMNRFIASLLYLAKNFHRHHERNERHGICCCQKFRGVRGDRGGEFFYGFPPRPACGTTLFIARFRVRRE